MRAASNLLVTHAGTFLLIMTVVIEWYVGITCIVVFDYIDSRVLNHVHTIISLAATWPIDCLVIDLLFVHVFFLFIC